MKKVRNVIIFIIIGILLFGVIQAVFVPKWRYPKFNEGITNSFEGFYQLKDDTVQVVFLGTSHGGSGISPLEIYDQSRITSYNLCTSGQNIAVSYYTLIEIFKTQNPKVVMLDASGLFREYWEPGWRYVLDTIPMSKNKLEFAQSYAQYEENTNVALLGAVLPMYRYHDRWDELNHNDYQLQRAGSLSKGYYLSSRLEKGFYTSESMNMELNSLTIPIEYNQEILPDNVEWFLKIKKLCEDNGAQLHLIKVPSVNSAVYYEASWTYQKYQQTGTLANTYQVPYIDMQYVQCVPINWSEDTGDEGCHMNYRGAQKISGFLADYLIQQGIVGYENPEYEVALDNYTRLCNLADLQLTYDLSEYLEKLRNYDGNLVICMVASDDMRANLSQENIRALESMGLKTNFQNMKVRDGFLAVIDSGNILYEQSATEAHIYQCSIDGLEYRIMSRGWYAQSGSMVSISEKDYSLNRRGLNIVVYDKDAGMVIDSVSFDTNYLSEDEGSRDNDQIEIYIREYEQYLTDLIVK